MTKKQLISLYGILCSTADLETLLKDLVAIGLRPTLMYNGFVWLSHMNADNGDFSRADDPLSALRKAMCRTATDAHTIN